MYEMTRDCILKQASTYFATFCAILFFGFIILKFILDTLFFNKVLASKFFVLLFILGRCFQFPDRSGILRENVFHFSLFFEKKNCILTSPPPMHFTYLVSNLAKHFLNLILCKISLTTCRSRSVSQAMGWAVGHLLAKPIIRPDQFNFWEHRFFSKFEGSVSRKKK